MSIDRTTILQQILLTSLPLLVGIFFIFIILIIWFFYSVNMGNWIDSTLDRDY